MSANGREIEVKLETVTSLSELQPILMQLARERGLLKSLSGVSKDTFWTLENRGADFLRLRDNGSKVEITVKGIDTDSQLDRMEEEFYSDSDVSHVENVLILALGWPNGDITKEHYTYWLMDHETVLSCYVVCVEHPKGPRHIPDVSFIEIESGSEERVLEVEQWLSEKLHNYGIKVKRSSGSLHDMFILVDSAND